MLDVVIRFVIYIYTCQKKLCYKVCLFADHRLALVLLIDNSQHVTLTKLYTYHCTQISAYVVPGLLGIGFVYKTVSVQEICAKFCNHTVMALFFKTM